MKLLAAFLLAVVAARGQGSNTIYQTLAVNQTSTSASFGPVNNIGQASHQAYATVSSVPGHTCVASQAFVQISLDGGNTPSIASSVTMPQQATAATGFDLVQASSIYPYVFVGVSFADPSGNCQWSAYYAGSVQTLTLIPNNLSQASVSTQSAGPGTITIVPAAGAQLSPFVFGYTLSTTGAAATAQLKCTNGSGTDYSNTFSLALGTPVIIPTNTVPAFFCGAGDRLDLVVTGAGATVFVTAVFAALPLVQNLF